MHADEAQEVVEHPGALVVQHREDHRRRRDGDADGNRKDDPEDRDAAQAHICQRRQPERDAQAKRHCVERVQHGDFERVAVIARRQRVAVLLQPDEDIRDAAERVVRVQAEPDRLEERIENEDRKGRE